jgi:uncharacterized membrane protein (DUF485 family)
MTETNGGGAAGMPVQADGERRIDWVAAERSPEFRELVERKRSFVVPATAFFLTWYLGFILLAGYAPDFLGEELLVDGITVGYGFALSQFVMVWVLTAWYLRRADRVFDPLAARAARRALETAAAAEPEPTPEATRSRFEREPSATEAAQHERPEVSTQ